MLALDQYSNYNTITTEKNIQRNQRFSWVTRHAQDLKGCHTNVGSNLTK